MPNAQNIIDLVESIPEYGFERSYHDGTGKWVYYKIYKLDNLIGSIGVYLDKGLVGRDPIEKKDLFKDTPPPEMEKIIKNLSSYVGKQLSMGVK